jgi:ubiquinone/menaquinone biosynthesis C-methylase UbiE
VAGFLLARDGGELMRRHSYLMENVEESIRLEMKTDPEAVRKQAIWCGLRPGMRVLDAGCGTGKVSAILHEMVGPDGEVLGLDYSEERISYATDRYGQGQKVKFAVHDLRDALPDLGSFDLVWVRFVLEYNRMEGMEIIDNLTSCLKPEGLLCLLDLDNNCLSHYELAPEMEAILKQIITEVERNFDFDPFSGRKLYAYLFDRKFRDISVEVMPHHLFYGEIKSTDMFNWIKKAEMVSRRLAPVFKVYPGGYETFFKDFNLFFRSPRRFTYTPLILCKGTKPLL